MRFLPFPIWTRFSITALVCLALAACGGESDPQSTPTPQGQSTSSGQMTVADLVAKSDASWPTVEYMRTTAVSGPIPTADAPFDQSNMTGSVQEWTRNGDRHVIEYENGIATNEQIYADGVIYMRGQFVSAVVAPGLDINTWVILDQSVVPDDTPVGVQIRYLTRAQENPYGNLTPETLLRPVAESGSVRVGERSCTLYTFGDENNTGTEIRYEIAIDDNGLPCQVIQRAGDFQNSTVYEFNVPGADVVAPTDGATPVSGTPEG